MKCEGVYEMLISKRNKTRDKWENTFHTVKIAGGYITLKSLKLQFKCCIAFQTLISAVGCQFEHILK